MVADPDLSQDCEVDILKEGFTKPPVDTPYGPVLAFDDVIGTKVRALADRGYARDLVDIHAASRLRSQAEMESLGRRLAWAPPNGAQTKSSPPTASARQQ